VSAKKVDNEVRRLKITRAQAIAWTIAHEVGHHDIGGLWTHPVEVGFIDAANGPGIGNKRPVFTDEGAVAFVKGLALYHEHQQPEE